MRVGIVAVVAACLAAVGWGDDRLNVLMIPIDDQRPELGCYGHKHMHTPNYDRLAARSMVMDRAYVQVALCSPSRTALLTSRRPDTSKVWQITPSEYWRKSGGNFTTLPEWFKNEGYLTIGMGKVFHPGAESGNQDIAYSWSPESNVGPKGNEPGKGLYEGYTKAPSPHNGTKSTHPSFWRYETDEDADVADGMLAQHAAQTIANMSAMAKGRPFFLAVGFHKPHVAWKVPRKYFDLYPNNTLAPHLTPPKGVPEIAMQTVIEGWSSGKYSDLTEMAKYEPFSANFPMDGTTLPAWKAGQLRQAYWAATSFTDSNIGVVLDALDAHGYTNNTIIALWGDHGYHLGDNDLWAKHTCFEHATRIPMFLHVPGYPTGRTDAIVEEVDLFPTLAEAATGKTVPTCPRDVGASRKTELCTEGRSMMPVLRGNKDNFDAAYSQYERLDETVMGYSIRVDAYRYTEWVGFDNTTGLPDWSKLVGRELYDHSASPVPTSWDMETENVVDDAEKADLVAQLSKRLRANAQRGGVV